MDFKDLVTTKKGDYGEFLVDEYYIKEGYTPYAPVTDGAHIIDRMYANKGTADVFISDVKTKPYRDKYPDTGLDTRHYNEYISASLRLGLNVKLIFVDEKYRAIYSNTLANLMMPQEEMIVKTGRVQQYPWEHGKQTFFLLRSMKRMRYLTDEEVDKLKSFK